MNAKERQLSRILFRNLILESDGQGFENLFTKIMGYALDDFVAMKQGARVSAFRIFVGLVYRLADPPGAGTDVDSLAG